MEEKEKNKSNVKNKIIIIESAALAILLAGTATFGGLFGSSTQKTNEINTQLNQATIEKEDLAEEVATLNTQIIADNEQIAQLQQQIADKEDELESVSIEKTSLETQVTTLTQEKASLEDEINTKQDEINTLNTRIAELTAALEQANADKESLNEEITTLNGEKNTLQIQVTAYQNQVADLQTQVTSLTSQLNDANSEKESLQAEVDSLTTTKENLEDEVEEKQSKIDDLTNKLADATALANTYTVFYVSGNSIVATKSVTKGNSVNEVPDVPTKAGYTGEWSNDGTNITSDMVIYPVYTQIVKEYKVNLQKADVYNEMSVVELMQSADKIVLGQTSKYINEVSGNAIDVGETDDDEVKAYYFDDSHTGKKDLYILADGDIVISKNDYTDSIDQTTVKATYDSKVAYLSADRSSLTSGDTFKILHDESHYNEITYYTYKGEDNEPTLSSSIPTSPFANLTSTTKIILENVDTSSLDNFSEFFMYDIALLNLDISGLDTNNSTDYYAMFGANIALEYVDTSYIYTGNTTELDMMFGYCASLTHVDISSWDTSNITSLAGTFLNASVENLDFSNCDLNKVTDLNSTFEGCLLLDDVDFGSSTIIPTTLSETFSDCINLNSIDISSFNLSNVTTMYETFHNCSNLNTITWPSVMNTENLTDLNYTFQGCCDLYGDYSTFSLSLNNFNTSKVINMVGTFDGCSRITSLDISSWDFSKVQTANRMFADCTSLRTIYVNDGSDLTALCSTSFFDGDTKLVGQNTTAYIDTNNYQYAKVDTFGNAGLFSVKNPYQISGNNYAGLSIYVNDVEATNSYTFNLLLKEGDSITLGADGSGYFALTLYRISRTERFTEANIYENGEIIYNNNDSLDYLTTYTFTIDEGYNYFIITSLGLA